MPIPHHPVIGFVCTLRHAHPKFTHGKLFSRKSCGVQTLHVGYFTHFQRKLALLCAEVGDRAALLEPATEAA